MRSLISLLLLCLCLSVATAQTSAKKKTTTAQKSTTTARKATTTPVKKPVASKPRSTTVAAATTEAAASTLTFPSTEPDNAATLDAQKKQQMYDELHGVKNQANTPDTGKKGRKTDKQRDADEMATRADRKTTTAAADEARTYIGVRVGGNYNTYLDKLTIPNGTGGIIDVTPSPMYGFHAGVVFQFGRGGVAFQPEINFNQDYLKTAAGTFSASSLVVPLFAKFQFGQQGNTRFFVNVGPYGAYSLESGSTETIIGYGGALGLGVGIPVGSGKVTVEARGYYPLGDSKGTYDFANIPGRPITGQFSLGYLFPLGSR
ncbi:porin family protein [Fibrella arboris]|uniref:porin family protein n=1 Tax=Fibrella arboris TaxID=3242486 RepID=UPI0035209D62